MYVATEFCAFVLVLDTESGVNTTSVISVVYAQPLIAVHVGVAVSDHAPLAPHVTTCTTPDASVKPSLHVYVRMVSYAPASAVVSAVPSTVRTPFACADGAFAHKIAVHVGVSSEDQLTEPTPVTEPTTPVTLHVRVVAALIANPTKQ